MVEARSVERILVTCPACGQQVEAVAADGRVRGYCTVAKQQVDFLIEAPPGIKQDPEYRAKVSAIIKRKWQDPEYRAMMSAAIKRYHQTPEYRTKMSEIIKRKQQDPEH